MATILDTIADYAKVRVAQDMQAVSFDEIKERALALGRGNGYLFT